jgi:hypothetical protein
MTFKIGDEVCYNPEYFEGTKSELIKEYGTGIITSEDYSKSRQRLRCHPPFRDEHPGIDNYYCIAIMWNASKEEYWEYIDYLCLVEERVKRDIWHELEEILCAKSK